MPFPEDPSGITRIREDVDHSDLVAVHDIPADTPHTSAGGVSAGHQRCPRRHTYGVGMEVGEAHGLVVEAVKLRCLQPWVTVAAQVTVALVVRQAHQDIRPVIGT